MTIIDKKWKGAFDSLKDIKEHLAELEYKFECREPEKECNKSFTALHLKIVTHEAALKELRTRSEKKKQ